MDILIFLKWFYPLDIQDRTIVNQDELDDQLEQDNAGEPKFKGDYDNEHMPSIVQIMINTIFGFGSVNDAEKSKNNNWYVGSSVEQEYQIGFVLFVAVVVLIPIFLFVKPCCFR